MQWPVAPAKSTNFYYILIFFHLFWSFTWRHGLFMTKTHQHQKKTCGIWIECSRPQDYLHLWHPTGKSDGLYDVPSPWFLPSNVQSQENRMDWETAHVLTETWFTPHILDKATALDGRGLFRADRTQDSSRQRGGLFIYMNNARCSGAVKVDGRCSPDVKFLMLRCRPFYRIFQTKKMHCRNYMTSSAATCPSHVAAEMNLIKVKVLYWSHVQRSAKFGLCI